MRKNIGWIAIILGGLTLSIELFFLKFMHIMESWAGLSWRRLSAAAYISEPVVSLSLLITVFIIVVGIIFIVRNRD